MVASEEAEMGEAGCAACPWRAKFDARPRSLLGRLWRWHATICPGWRAYMRSLPEETKRDFVERYHLRADRFA